MHCTCAVEVKTKYRAVKEKISFVVFVLLIKMETKGIESRIRSYKYNDKDPAVSRLQHIAETF